MNPKHKNPTKPYRIAHAPYNFVPLPEKVVTVEEKSIPGQDAYTGNTGYIDCELITETPLYTRPAMTPEFFRQYGDKNFDQLGEAQKVELAQFFSAGRPGQPLQPVIPGSSLRGMVRSLVEIAGYGKMQWVTGDSKVTFRAVAASKNNPLTEPYWKVMGKFGRNVMAGYLVKKKDAWYIHPAKRPADFGWPDKKAYLEVKEKNIPEKDLPGLIHLNDSKYRPQYHEVSFNRITQESKFGKFSFVTNIGTVNASHKYHGILFCSGNMLETAKENQQTKRSTYTLILERDNKAELLKIDEKVIRDYLNGLTPFQKEKPFNEHTGCFIDGHPVFYTIKENKVYYFGHCPNFRVPAIPNGQISAVSPYDLIPFHLRNQRDIDLAEAIFGY
ncbi:MAG: TIGR03986 family type III CRISPR-associated RAMP protein, partial [Eubacteriales bacterium]